MVLKHSSDNRFHCIRSRCLLFYLGQNSFLFCLSILYQRLWTVDIEDLDCRQDGQRSTSCVNAFIICVEFLVTSCLIHMQIPNATANDAPIIPSQTCRSEQPRVGQCLSSKGQDVMWTGLTSEPVPCLSIHHSPLISYPVQVSSDDVHDQSETINPFTATRLVRLNSVFLVPYGHMVQALMV